MRLTSSMTRGFKVSQRLRRRFRSGAPPFSIDGPPAAAGTRLRGKILRQGVGPDSASQERRQHDIGNYRERQRERQGSPGKHLENVGQGEEVKGASVHPRHRERGRRELEAEF
jgi:hypothetical protein